MKNKFISLLVDTNHKQSIILFVISAILIAISLIIGLTDNLPMIILFFVGIVLFFFALLRFWAKVSYSAVLVVVSILIFILNWFFKWYLGEDIAMTVGFISVAVIFAGFLGIFTFAGRKEQS